MAARVVPGPLTRLRRSRLTLFAVLVLATFAAGAGYMREAAFVRLQGTVDANWRGAFDLLVRPQGARLPIEDTAGLVEPNYLSFSGEGGISLADLERIRDLPTVELAAPVATIGNVRYVVGGPAIAIAELPEQPTLYELVVRAESSDGVESVLVQEERARLLIGPADLSADTVPFSIETGSFSWGVDGLYVFLSSLPAIASPVIAVDPVAERELLGSSTEFLAPLEAVAALPEAPIARDFELVRIPEVFEDQRFLVSALATDPNSPAARRPVIPVAVSSTIYAPLTISLQVSQVGQPLADYPTGANEDERLATASQQAGDGLTEVGASSIDASESLRPLQPPMLEILWPGSGEPPGSAGSIGVAADLTAELAGRPEYTALAPRREGGPLAFGVEPQGWVDSSGTVREAAASDERLRIGLEPAFRPSRPASVPLLETYQPTGPLDRPFVFAPVSQFDLDSLDLPVNPLNYVPLGAYSAPDTTYVAGPDGEPVEPVSMTPTLNPRGLTTLPPLAITDLRSAVTLRGEAPIDAIRIRVAGIDRFDDAAIARVERAASAIAAMGFDVDIVAGSSPQPVEVLVAGLGDDGASAPRGWVEQPWTTLGAAERVVVGFSTINTALLILSALTALTLGSGLLVMQRAVRRSEVGVLNALGWSRWQVARWMVGEALWAGGLVLVIGVAAWWLAGRGSPIGLAVSVALAALLPIVAAAGALAALRAGVTSKAVSSGDIDVRTARVVSHVGRPFTYGLRTAVARPVRSLVIAVALAIASASAAAGAVTVATTATAVGPTRLAQALAQQLGLAQVGMLLAAVVGTAIVGFALLRMDLASRRTELRVLAACGWDGRHTRTMLFAHRLAIAGPAVIAAAGVGWLLSVGLLGQRDLVVLAIAPVTVLALLMTEVRWSTR